MKIKKCNTEMHFVVLGILLMSGLAVVYPDFFKQSLTSILHTPSIENSVVQNSSTDTPGQTNISILDARLDEETRTVSVILRTTGTPPQKAFTITIMDTKILVTPDQLSLDYPTIITVPLSTIVPSMTVIVDGENSIMETTKEDNTFVVLGAVHI